MYKQLHETVANRGLSNCMSRKVAWCLLLGVSQSTLNDFYGSLYDGYLTDVFSLAKSTEADFEVQRMIKLDVKRTFSEKHFPQLEAVCDEGRNPLFNVLAAYAKHNPEVGYT